MLQIHGHARCWLAGRKVLTLQTIAPKVNKNHDLERIANVSGFNLQAGVMARSDERDKLERLCRSAVSEKRLSVTRHGKIRYQLKTPFLQDS